MATITRLRSNHWRVQARRKQSYVSTSFLRHEGARKWAIATERRIDLGESTLKRAKADPRTFARLVDLHVDDMCEVGQAPRRSKAFTRNALEDKLGKVKFKEPTRERLMIPTGRIVHFTIASTMRQQDICRIRWSDVDITDRVVLVRDRKDSREKDIAGAPSRVQAGLDMRLNMKHR